MKRMTLHAGALGHHADGGAHRTDAAMQRHRGFDDAAAGIRLALGPAFEV